MSTARSMSASCVTISGLFPPSSKLRRLNVPASSLLISFPTSVEPVNEILSTPSCRTSRRPVSSSPGIMLTTPGGKPASIVSSARRFALKGVCGAVFRTTAHPAASAGANFQVAMASGKFQGAIAPTTPTGSRSTYATVSGVTSGPLGRTSCACEFWALPEQ